MLGNALLATPAEGSHPLRRSVRRLAATGAVGDPPRASLPRTVSSTSLDLPHLQKPDPDPPPRVPHTRPCEDDAPGTTAPPADSVVLPSDSDGTRVPDWDPYRDKTDRRLLPSVFREICYLADETPNVDLFADEWNTHCERYFTAKTDAFRQQWTSISGWCNPPFVSDTIKATFVRAEAAWRRPPDTTSFIIICPAWEGASWNPAVCPSAAVFQKIKTFPVGTLLFDAPGATPGAPRRPLGPVRWPVDVFHLLASARVVTSVTDDVLAHLRIGHLSCNVMTSLIDRRTLPVKHLGPQAKRAAMEVARRCRTCVKSGDPWAGIGAQETQADRREKGVHPLTHLGVLASTLRGAEVMEVLEKSKVN